MRTAGPTNDFFSPKFYYLVRENEYCIRVHGGRTNTPGCNWTWGSSTLHLFQNGNQLNQIMANGFSQQDFCFDLQNVDPENDIFELKTTGTDGVSFPKIIFFKQIDFQSLKPHWT